MTILSNYTDKLTGATLTGVTLTTYPHSLPGTNPQEMRLQVRSVLSATAHGQLYAIGGNASLLTIGLSGASIALGSNAVYFDSYNTVLHSIIC